MGCYLDTGAKVECLGCEACAQSCPLGIISMEEDDEGFRYPRIDEDACIDCSKCHMSCPMAIEVPRHPEEKRYVFGGSIADEALLEQSTSGGIFTALAMTWLRNDGAAVFGAASQGLAVAHASTRDESGIAPFRRSKYMQSEIGSCFAQARKLLHSGQKVLFSGTPCQIAGLRAFLGETPRENLLTVEVVCEGVPSPLYIRSLDRHARRKYGAGISQIHYRLKDGRRWDFEVMSLVLENGKMLKVDRWFNPFWPFFVGHLMSRPSCYECPFATASRVADITLGDLWGVHLYCPDLYRKNAGASLAICNSEKGREILELAKPRLIGRELPFEQALKYQGPLRAHIAQNPDRDAFLHDLRELEYPELVRKWSSGPSVKLLFQKYVWGNRQKVALWNLKKKIHRGKQHPD